LISFDGEKLPVSLKETKSFDVLQKLWCCLKVMFIGSEENPSLGLFIEDLIGEYKP